MGMRKHTADTGKKPLQSRGAIPEAKKILVFGVSNDVFNVTLHKGKRNVSSKYYAVYYLLCAAPASSQRLGIQST